MTARTLTAPRPGPVLLAIDLPAGAITVTAEPGRKVAELTVTATGDDPALHTAVNDAKLLWNAAQCTMVAEVPLPAGPTGDRQTVIGNNACTIVQSFGDVPAGVTITGGVFTTGGGRVVIDGVTVTGGSGLVVGGIEVAARVPEGTRVSVLTRSASMTAIGEYASVAFDSVSGDLTAGGAGTLRASTTSGDVRAAAVDGTATVRTVSGDIRLGRADAIQATTTSGDITVTDFGGQGHAEAVTVSGDITAHAAEGGTIHARSVSGDVYVTAAPAALAEGLTVTADSRAGHVTTPDHAPAAAARARRPRRSTTDF